MDPTIYQFQVTYMHRKEYIVNGKPEYKLELAPVNTVPCSETSLAKNPMFADQAVQKLWCLEEFKTPTGQLLLRGQFTSNKYGSILIDIKRCTGSHCKDEATITEKLKNTQMGIFYSNSVLQTSNYDAPVAKYNTLFYTNLSPFFSKEVTMSMVDHEIRTQSSITNYLPFKTKRMSLVDRFDTNLVSVSQQTDFPETIFRLVIGMNGRKVIINRVYQTLFEVLAVLGGVFKLFTFICFFISSKIAPTVLKLDLALRLSMIDNSDASIAPQTPQISTAEKKFKGAHFGHPREENRNSKNKKPVFGKVKSVKSFMLPAKHQAFQRQAADSVNEFPEEFDLPGSEKKIITPPDQVWSKNQHREKVFAQQSSAKPILRTHFNTNKIAVFSQNEQSPKPASAVLQEKLSNIGFWKVLAFSFFPFLMSKHSNIKEVVNHMNETVMSKLDYIHLLKVMEDLHKIRLLAFGPGQQDAFDLLSARQVEAILEQTKEPHDFISIPEHRGLVDELQVELRRGE
jgi:hypothetical protein